MSVGPSFREPTPLEELRYRLAYAAQVRAIAWALAFALVLGVVVAGAWAYGRARYAAGVERGYREQQELDDRRAWDADG